MEEKHEKKTSEKKEKSKNNFTEHLRKNPWVLSTLVLGVVVLILLVGNFGAVGGKAISQDDAEATFLNFLENSGADLNDIEITGITQESNMYAIEIDYQGEAYPVPFFLTLDGKYLGNMNEISTAKTSDTSSTETEIPESDNPVVELFIWSYCPYGVQAQTPFAEVAKLLGDSSDFKVVLYYAGHGPHEVEQNKIQECIQQIAPEKYWDYAESFVENIYPKCGTEKTEECDKTESTALMKSLGIDSDAVFSCVETQGDDLQTAASARAKEVGVTGSPTLVINGVKANVARTAESFKTAICSAFTTAPEACETELSDDAATASGNC